MLKHFLLPSPRWCLSSGPLKLPTSRRARRPAANTVFYELTVKINCMAKVREKTKTHPSASGEVDSPTAQRVNALTVASITGIALHKHKVRALPVSPGTPEATVWQPHLKTPG